MNVKRILNSILTGILSATTLAGSVILATTAISTAATSIPAAILLGLGSVTLGVISAITANTLLEAVRTEDFRAVDGISEMLFDSIVSNTIRILFNAVVLSALKTPRIPNIRNLFGRRNSTDSTSVEVDGVIVTTF